MQKSGYLYQNFRLFHIRDKKRCEFDYHYHDFNKIIIFLSGNVTYLIEGKTYYLKPWDILLVNHHAIHKPIIDPNTYYERIVIWIDEAYMQSVSHLHNDMIPINNIVTNMHDDTDITACFKKASERSFNLIRLDTTLIERVRYTICNLENALKPESDNYYGITLLRKLLFLEFMVYINQVFLGKQYGRDSITLKYDARIEGVLKFINDNLSCELTVDYIAEKFFLSKYHLMHKFKEETGYTLHHYILQKRLLLAKEYMAQGMPVTKAAFASGFTDYSTYHRAMKRIFPEPKEDS